MANSCDIKHFLEKIIPILRWLPNYNRNWFIRDLLAGLTICTSIAYAVVAGLPPQAGLYCTIASAPIHLFFGISPFMSPGPFAITSLMLGSTVLSCAQWLASENIVGTLGEEMDFPWQEFPLLYPLATFLTLLTSIVLFLIFITNASRILNKVLPRELISSFTCAASVTIVISQLKHVLGVKVPAITGTFTIYKTLYGIFENISDFKWIAFVVAGTTMLMLALIETIQEKFEWVRFKNQVRGIFSKRCAYPPNPQLPCGPSSASQKASVLFPSVLFVIALMAALSFGLGLNTRFGLRVVGYVPNELPPFSVPWKVFETIPSNYVGGVLLTMLPGALSIALVTFVTLKSIIDTFPTPSCLSVMSSIDTAVEPSTPKIIVNTDAEFTARESSHPQVNHSESDRADDFMPPGVHQELEHTNSGAHHSQSELVDLSCASSTRNETSRGNKNIISDHSNEMLSLSLANLACAFFSGYVPCGSLSRTAILAKQTQATTPLTNTISAIVVILATSFLSSAIFYIPMACLAGVIIMSLRSTVLKIRQALALLRLARQKNDRECWKNLSVWVLEFLSVIVLDTSYGIMIGMGYVALWDLFIYLYDRRQPNASNTIDE